MFINIFKFRLIISRLVKSRFIKLFLVASIISVSVPNKEVLAIWPFSKSSSNKGSIFSLFSKTHKKNSSSFVSKAVGGLFVVSIFAACAFGFYKLFLSDMFNKPATDPVEPEPPTDVIVPPVSVLVSQKKVGEDKDGKVVEDKEKFLITIVVGDITKQVFRDPAHCAIVNAANRALVDGSGITGAIWKASGGLTDLCKQELLDPKNANKVDENGLKTGQAVITALRKPKDDKKDDKVVDWVIHTPGPDCRDENQKNDRKNLLESSYTNCLRVADENGITTVAFPSISTGIYGYPADQANEVAISAVINYLKNNKETTGIKEVRFVAFNKKIYDTYCQALQKQEKLPENNGLGFEIVAEPLVVNPVKNPEGQEVPPVINLAQNPVNQVLPTFEAWRNKCNNLPKYATAKNHGYKDTALTKDELVVVVQEFLRVVGQSSFANNNNWAGNTGPVDVNFDIKSERDFNARNTNNLGGLFVQKIDLPKNAEVSLHGDIHADVHSVIAYLGDLYKAGVIDNNFRIIRDNFYITFLGDYTDRGCYGAEVWFTIMCLKIANPEKVILIRGNHEDLDINKDPNCGGFYNELRAKFGFQEEYINYLLTKIYNCLPAAVFVGSFISSENKSISSENKRDYALFCHGGLEHKFNSLALLSKVLNPGECFFDRLGAQDVGFQWNDFHSRPNIQNEFDPGRGFKFDLPTARDILREFSSDENGYRVVFQFRGHQHNGNLLNDMIAGHGICNNQAPNQWNGKSKAVKLDKNFPIWTMNVSPDGVYGERKRYRFDNYSVLKLSGKSENWTLEPHKLVIAN